MAKEASQKKWQDILLWMTPLHRVLIASAITIITFIFIRKNFFGGPLLAILLWDVFAFCYTLATWLIILTRSTIQLRAQARIEDGSRTFVFSSIIIASIACMCTVVLLIVSKEGSQSSLYLPVSIAGMLLSWTIVHTTFCLHYAYLFYDDDANDATKHAEGLDFPNEEKPDLLDFAYFAFVIGMTFQVSDVEVTSRIIRRTVLFHGLLSFVLNTFVVALTVNLIAGLKT